MPPPEFLLLALGKGLNRVGTVHKCVMAALPAALHAFIQSLRAGGRAGVHR